MEYDNKEAEQMTFAALECLIRKEYTKLIELEAQVSTPIGKTARATFP